MELYSFLCQVYIVRIVYFIFNYFKHQFFYFEIFFFFFHFELSYTYKSLLQIYFRKTRKGCFPAAMWDVRQPCCLIGEEPGVMLAMGFSSIAD